jgi:hypothetical protein
MDVQNALIITVTSLIVGNYVIKVMIVKEIEMDVQSA